MELLARPDYMIGSDAIPTGGLPHPRAYGCFPRVLGRLEEDINIQLNKLFKELLKTLLKDLIYRKEGI